MEEKILKHKSRHGTPLYYSLVEGTEKPVIVMIHNMWGSHKTFRRHIELLNAHGYTCVSFNLFQASHIHRDHSYTWQRYFQFMYINWIHQITDVLDSIPGRKIVFSLSGPSLAGLIAASERTDIERYICDGGPFKEFWQCTYRMYSIEKPIKNPVLRFLWTTVSCIYWGPFAYTHLTQQLHKWNPKIPILSLRGQRDPIVYPENIEHVFEPHPHIKLHTHIIKEGHHLDGLKLFPEDYSKAVLNFLTTE